EATASGDDVRVGFPDDGGTIRGRLDHGALAAFWVRRAVVDDPEYPAGAAQAYATPLPLDAAGDGRCRAKEAPLPDPFTLYLEIRRGADGALTAAFRNPELHSYGPAKQVRVTQTGDTIRFSARPDPQKPEVHLDGALLHTPDRISVVWPDL